MYEEGCNSRGDITSSHSKGVSRAGYMKSERVREDSSGHYRVDRSNLSLDPTACGSEILQFVLCREVRITETDSARVTRLAHLTTFARMIGTIARDSGQPLCSALSINRKVVTTRASRPQMSRRSSSSRCNSMSTLSPPSLPLKPLLLSLLLLLLSAPTGRIEIVSCKGLVGKVPGNPASCPEEPCNSDPQHVLYALKWTSLGFGIILLLPLLMYYTSKLISKLHSLFRGSPKSTGRDKMETRVSSVKSKKFDNSSSGDGRRKAGSASSPDDSSQSPRTASCSSATCSTSSHSTDHLGGLSGSNSNNINNNELAARNSITNTLPTTIGPANFDSSQRHQRVFQAQQATNPRDQQQQQQQQQHQHQLALQPMVVQQKHHHQWQQQHQQFNRGKSSSLSSLDAANLAENIMLSEELAEKNRQIAELIAAQKEQQQQQMQLQHHHHLRQHHQTRGSRKKSSGGGNNEGEETSPLGKKWDKNSLVIGGRQLDLDASYRGKQHRYSMVPDAAAIIPRLRLHDTKNRVRHSLKTRPGSSSRRTMLVYPSEQFKAVQQLPNGIANPLELDCSKLEVSVERSRRTSLERRQSKHHYKNENNALDQSWLHQAGSNSRKGSANEKNGDKCDQLYMDQQQVGAFDYPYSQGEHHHHQQKQQQQQQQYQQQQPNGLLALPANAAQYRHSIDGSILNNMVFGLQVNSGSGSNNDLNPMEQTVRSSSFRNEGANSNVPNKEQQRRESRTTNKALRKQHIELQQQQQDAIGNSNQYQNNLLSSLHHHTSQRNRSPSLNVTKLH